MTDELKRPNIHQRLQAVMRAVSYIQKDKRVESYMAVTHDAVTAMVREHFITQGIVIESTLLEGKTVDTGRRTSKDNPIIRFEGVYEISFVNVDEPDNRIRVRRAAHGDDQGDKGPGKAESYAIKMAILKILMIETGESDESRVGPKDEELTPELEVTLQSLRDASLNGLPALKSAWEGLTEPQRVSLRGHLQSLKQAAKEAGGSDAAG